MHKVNCSSLESSTWICSGVTVTATIVPTLNPADLRCADTANDVTAFPVAAGGEPQSSSQSLSQLQDVATCDHRCPTIPAWPTFNLC